MSGAMVDAVDIQWTLEPLPAAPLALSDDDVLARAISEADGYRQLAQAAIHRLHDVEAELTRERARHHRLLDSYRALRTQVAEAA